MNVYYTRPQLRRGVELLREGDHAYDRALDDVLELIEQEMK